MGIHCPMCGAELPKPRWKGMPHTSCEIADVKCRECGADIALSDYSSFEQEGTVEIVFR